MGAALEGVCKMSYSYATMRRGLYRSRHGILFGVCEGLARRFDFSPWGMRLAFLLLQFTFVPLMFAVYIVLALAMKKEPWTDWRETEF